MVPVDRVQEKVQYKQVNRKVVHYPQFDRQFVEDAERSGRIIANPGPGLAGSQVVANGPVQSLTQRSGLFASQAFARPAAFQQVPIQQVPLQRAPLQQSFVRATPNVYQSQFLQPSVVQREVPVRNGLGLGASQVRPIIGSPTIRNYPYTQPHFVEEGERQSITMKKKKGQK